MHLFIRFGPVGFQLLMFRGQRKNFFDLFAGLHHVGWTQGTGLTHNRLDL